VYSRDGDFKDEEHIKGCCRRLLKGPRDGDPKGCSLLFRAEI